MLTVCQWTDDWHGQVAAWLTVLSVISNNCYCHLADSVFDANILSPTICPSLFADVA